MRTELHAEDQIKLHTRYAHDQDGIPRLVSELRDGELHVEGMRHTLIQARGFNTINFQLREVYLSEGFSGWSETPTFSRSVRGLARIDRDTFQVAGLPQLKKTSELELSIWDGKPDQWKGTIGFLAHDWEIGNRDEWFVQLWIPPTAVDALRDALFAGRVKQITVSISQHEMWTESFNEHAPPAVGKSWYLIAKNGEKADRAESSFCNVTSLIWSNKMPDPWPFEMGKQFAHETLAVADKDEARRQTQTATTVDYSVYIKVAVGLLTAILIVLVLR